jgi:hypothetical protein
MLWLWLALPLACNAITGADRYTNVDDGSASPDASADAKPDTGVMPTCDAACLTAATTCGASCERTRLDCRAPCSNMGCTKQCDMTAMTCSASCGATCETCGAGACKKPECDKAINAGEQDAGAD